MVIDNMARILHMEGADIGNVGAQHNGCSLVKIHTCAVNDQHVSDKMASRKGFSDCDSDCTNTSMPEKSTASSVSTRSSSGKGSTEEHSSLSWLRCDWDQHDKTLCNLCLFLYMHCTCTKDVLHFL